MPAEVEGEIPTEVGAEKHEEKEAEAIAASGAKSFENSTAFSKKAPEAFCRGRIKDQGLRIREGEKRP